MNRAKAALAAVAVAVATTAALTGCTQPPPTTGTTVPSGGLALGCYNGTGTDADLKVDDHLYNPPPAGVHTASRMGTTNGTCGPPTGADVVLVKDTSPTGETAAGTCAMLLGTGGDVLQANLTYPTINSAWWICL